MDEHYWARLPPFYRSAVVTNLSFKDRVSFQQTSKANQELVKRTPITVDSVRITDLSPANEFIMTMEDFTNGPDTEQDPLYYNARGPTICKKLVDRFKHRRSMIKFFCVDIYNKQALEFLKDLYKEIESQKLQLRAKKFVFDYSKDGKQDQGIELLKFFDPSCLEIVHLEYPMSRTATAQLLDSKQWKRAREVRIMDCYDLPIEKMMLANRIRCHSSQLTPKDVWFVIKDFCSNPRPAFSYFQFGVKDLQVYQVLQLFDVPINYVLNKTRDPDFHRQFFDTRFNEFYLDVKLTTSKVKGTLYPRHPQPIEILNYAAVIHDVIPTKDITFYVSSYDSNFRLFSKGYEVSGEHLSTNFIDWYKTMNLRKKPTYMLSLKIIRRDASWIISDLIGKIKAVSELFKLKTRKMWFDVAKDPDNQCIELLKCLDPNYLEHIRFKHELSPSATKKLLETEQWKHAKSVHIVNKYNLPMHKVLYGNNVYCEKSQMSPEKLWYTIKEYRRKPRPVDSYFKFGVNDLNVPRVLTLFDVPVDYSLNPEKDPHSHVQSFKTRFKDLALVVRIGRRFVEGKLCYKSLVESEAFNRWYI